MIETGRPLVTFALFAYNQEKYIREAVASAFAQTYSPLEIILSDDCSADRTFEIIQEMTANYSDSHKITLNRNSTNLHISGHINVVMAMVATDFVVVAAGDDISLPHRVSTLVEAWLSSGKKAKSIYSLAEDMNIEGEVTGCVRAGSEIKKLNDISEHANSNNYVLGATHAWDMDLFRTFPPLNASVVNEDVVLPARAAMIGEVQFISRVLVRYRSGIGISHEHVRRLREGRYHQTAEMLKRPYSCFVQKTADYKHADFYREYRDVMRARRAEYLMPFWLVKHNKLTRIKLVFFLRRCAAAVLLKEFIRWKFPWLVELKKKIQFLSIAGI